MWRSFSQPGPSVGRLRGYEGGWTTKVGAVPRSGLEDPPRFTESVRITPVPRAPR